MRLLEIKKDFANEELVFHKSQDCTDILEHNIETYNEPPEDLSFGRRVASVPIDVLDAWINEGIDYRLIKRDPAMRKKFFAKLNSPEWRYFKTHPGKIG